MTTTFQPAPEPGSSLLLPAPVIEPGPGGDWVYRFDVRLKRPGGKTDLLQTVTWTSSVPIRLLSGDGTPALASVLLPAMALGLPLTVEAPVSPFFLANLGTTQKIFANWFPHLRRVEVTAPAAIPSPAESPVGTAAFFSAGVDGFYTLQRHLGEVSTLVLLHGFDIDLERIRHRVAVENLVTDIATDLRRELVILQTNLRTFSDRYVWWGEMCGLTLAAAAHLLEGSVGRMLVASSNTYADFIPFGTTALTDPLLSTEGMTLVHDGGDRSRIDKVFDLAGWDYARERLRVCWRMQEATLNCCACDKCLRTMTSLWLAGVLDRCPTFQEPLSPDRIAAHPLQPAHAWFAIENLRRARERGLDHHPIMQAWQQALDRPPLAGAPPDPTSLQQAIDNDPLTSLWLSDHLDDLIRDTGAVNPAALRNALNRHAPGMLGDFLRAYAWKAPAALAGQAFRRWRSSWR